ncbi:shikimate kinase, partial [Bacillus velezensis]|uniref:shikimate kinase n=1 Tax=Bacillus velezensis TaxID=492670 RepID=UPI0024BD6EF6
STGGGVAINAEKRKIMRRSVLVFFLEASFEDIYKRIQHDPNRPIVQSSTKEEPESLYHYRRNFYRVVGHIQVLTEGRTIR